MLFYYFLTFYFYFCVLFGNPETASLNGSSSCATPDGQLGTCISLYSCPTLSNLIMTDVHEPSKVTYLRRSQCGMKNNTPKVCCPRTNIVFKIPPTRAAVTPDVVLVTPTPNTRSNPNIGSNTDLSQCGQSDRKEVRYLVPSRVKLGDWPWMVALGYRSTTNSSTQFKCGATLISDKWVVTAAHCVSNGASLTLTAARVGDIDLDGNTYDNSTPVDMLVDEIILHPEYSSSPVTNDIALIRLKDQVMFTKSIRPICILSNSEHRSDEFYYWKFPFITGWGAKDWSTRTINPLQETQVQVIENEKCAQNYASDGSLFIDQRVLCAIRWEKQDCLSDPGGPLIVRIRGKGGTYTYYLAGIASHVIRCTDSDLPMVYTKVAQFSDWITRTVGF